MRIRPWPAVILVSAIFLAAFLAFASAQTNPQFAGILTNRYDNARDGLNANETLLTPSNVTSQFFGKVFSDSVDGNIYAEPLYVPGVTINGQTHNVAYVATEHDSVYALDADAGAAPLWQISFINPANGITTVNSQTVSAKNPAPGCVDINPEYGITATPVIDPSTGTIYVLANTSENGTNTYRLHALDITTGQEKFGGPVLIQASSSGSGDDGDVFDPTQEMGRPGLLLQSGVVYVGFGSHCDLDPWHGWLLGYSTTTLTQMFVYNVTTNGSEGAIWQGGTGPASDQSGDIFLATGNGTADGGNGVDFGDSFLRLGIRSGAFEVIDFFTPFNDASLQTNDYDLGSAGVVILPDQSTGPTHIMVGAGKEGKIYLVNRDNLGKFSPNSDNVLFEVPSPSENNILSWSTPAYWNGHIYFIMSKDVARSYALNNDSLSLASQGTHTFPFLGSQPVISANGTGNGILWTLESTTGSSVNPVAGVLHAYDPLDLTQEYYNSNQNGSRDVPGPAVKFTVPTVANGKVYTGSTTQLDVFGTTAVKITAPANEATVSGTVTISISNASGVTWSNVYIDGVYFASTPPSTFSWNSTAVADGSHTISATAFGSSSSVLGAANISVNVHNGGGTPTATTTPAATPTATASAAPTPTATATAAPTPTAVQTSSAVQITAPQNGATVSGTTTISVVQGPGAAWINVYIDGTYFASTPPTSFSWNTTTVANGSHTISATAFNSSSTAVSTAAVTVTVGTPMATATQTPTPGTIQRIGATSTTNGQVTVPSGVQNGDLLLAFFSYWSPASATAPAGWTFLNTSVNSSSGTETAWYRIANNDTPGSAYTWAFSGPGPYESGGMLAYRGVDTSQVVDGFCNNMGLSTVPNWCSFNTAFGGDEIVALIATENTGLVMPGDLTQNVLLQYSHGNYFGVAAADKTLGAAGTVPADSGSMSSGGWGTVAFALKPAGLSPPSPTPVPSGISFISSYQTTNGTLKIPAGVQTDDLLLAFFSYWHIATAAAPPGWTQLQTEPSSSSGVETVWYRFATASDTPGTNYIWNFSGPGPYASGGMLAYRDVATVSLQDTFCLDSGNNNNPTLCSITTTASNDVYLGFYCTENTGLVLPGDLTSRVLQQYSNGSFFGSAAADKQLGAAGAVAADTSSMNPGGWETIVVALKHL